eukprot:CAMPEP_0174703892 /NCGR_PEP_ID=MMETSP1094-20130205/7675_1 /TAXON_ID=156173 /ORGANISM="Chrysochromulina brevifilum, Strain UTEX LB 985" /LENGTH=204 /DNA_ID=CAMNT_0015901869 /DNA_START=438 /DNA_END=1053 /DNA_ORIENTATION=-
MCDQCMLAQQGMDGFRAEQHARRTSARDTHPPMHIRLKKLEHAQHQLNHVVEQLGVRRVHFGRVSNGAAAASHLFGGRVETRPRICHLDDGGERGSQQGRARPLGTPRKPPSSRCHVSARSTLLTPLPLVLWRRSRRGSLTAGGIKEWQKRLRFRGEHPCIVGWPQQPDPSGLLAGGAAPHPTGAATSVVVGPERRVRSVLSEF